MEKFGCRLVSQSLYNQVPVRFDFSKRIFIIWTLAGKD